jgi:hypothetical protein
MTDILTKLAGLTQKDDFPYLFPIHLGSDGRKAYIPRAMIAPHEEWAQRNHSQSLQRLAERGGLGWCEALAVLENRRWSRDEAAQAKVLKLWHDWQERRDSALISLVREAEEEIEGMQAALAYIEKACLCGHHTTHTKGFEYHQKHARMGNATAGGRWLTPRERINTLRLELLKSKQTLNPQEAAP